MPQHTAAVDPVAHRDSLVEIQAAPGRVGVERHDKGQLDDRSGRKELVLTFAEERVPIRVGRERRRLARQ